MVSSVSTADRVGPQSLRTVRGSSSVFVQVTTAPALIVKNMAINKSSLIPLSETGSKAEYPAFATVPATANPLERRLRDGPVYSHCAMKILSSRLKIAISPCSPPAIRCGCPGWSAQVGQRERMSIPIVRRNFSQARSVEFPQLQHGRLEGLTRLARSPGNRESHN